ncbi:MAG: hypothetical protein GY832_37500 [Chloroflexi bacterium]|nr:hypothetical protein [Chloroflexota bacterium]
MNREMWGRIGRAGMILLSVVVCVSCWYLAIRLGFGTRHLTATLAGIVLGCVCFGVFSAVIELWWGKHNE